MNPREAAKKTARAAAHVVAFPVVLWFTAAAKLADRDRALHSTSQLMSLIPGLIGQYLRRAFYARALEHCADTAVIEFGTLISRAGTRLDDYAYVGPHCHLGLVHVERDALIAAGVHIPSGPETHGFADLSKPIREQPGTERRVRVGAGAWIGERAVVLADVGPEAVVGAGSVVTHPVPAWAVCVGVPARVLRFRRAVGA